MDKGYWATDTHERLEEKFMIEPRFEPGSSWQRCLRPKKLISTEKSAGPRIEPGISWSVGNYVTTKQTSGCFHYLMFLFVYPPLLLETYKPVSRSGGTVFGQLIGASLTCGQQSAWTRTWELKTEHGGKRRVKHTNIVEYSSSREKSRDRAGNRTQDLLIAINEYTIEPSNRTKISNYQIKTYIISWMHGLIRADSLYPQAQCPYQSRNCQTSSFQKQRANENPVEYSS